MAPTTGEDSASEGFCSDDGHKQRQTNARYKIAKSSKVVSGASTPNEAKSASRNRHKRPKRDKNVREGAQIESEETSHGDSTSEAGSGQEKETAGSVGKKRKRGGVADDHDFHD